MAALVALESPPGETAVLGGAFFPLAGVNASVAMPGVVGTELDSVVTALVDSAALSDIFRFWQVACIVVVHRLFQYANFWVQIRTHCTNLLWAATEIAFLLSDLSHEMVAYNSIYDWVFVK